MKNIIKTCLMILSVCSIAAATAPVTKYNLPSVDFAKRFGKHCTSHKNMIGRQVSGLCDDANLCNDVDQYKACYVNCIQNRTKEDKKTTDILGNLAACHNNLKDKNGYPIVRPNSIIGSDKEARAIFEQANLRLNRDRYQVKNVQTFEMPADRYQPERTPGINSVKSLNPFSTNCTTHKNALGITTNGVCDNGKQCTAAGYKKCYTSCVEKRKVDEKTYYVLKQLVKCPIDNRDLELGAMANDVRYKYHMYERQNHPTLAPTPKKVEQPVNKQDDVGASYLNALKKRPAQAPAVH